MCCPLSVAFSSLSDINTTLKTGITIIWSFTLRYVITTTSIWCWKKISNNDVTSIPIRNRSISWCKSNKKQMSPQYWVSADHLSWSLLEIMIWSIVMLRFVKIFKDLLLMLRLINMNIYWGINCNWQMYFHFCAR